MQQLVKIERGVTLDPRISTIAGLARALGVSIDVLAAPLLAPRRDTPKRRRSPRAA